MTTIVGCVQNPGSGVVLMGDNQKDCGGRRFIGEQKILEFDQGHVAIGFVGVSAIRLAARLQLNLYESMPIAEVSKQLRTMFDNIELSPEKETETPCYPFAALVALGNRLFEIHCDLTWTEHSTATAIGSGGDVARGAIASAFWFNVADRSKPELFCSNIIQIAKSHDIYTGDPVEGVFVKPRPQEVVA